MTRLPIVLIVTLILVLGSSALTSAQTPESGLTMAEGRTLTAEDCTVEPRSREEMLSILSTTPQANTVTAARPLPLTQEAYDAVQAAFFEWQACFAFHLTWQWAALETPYRLGQRVYGYDNYGLDPGIFNDTPAGGLLNTPFSKATLNDILDAWETTDASLRADQEATGFTQVTEVYVIDPDTMFYQEFADGSQRLWTTGYVYGPNWVTAPESHDFQSLFWYVDGSWHLESISRQLG